MYIPRVLSPRSFMPLDNTYSISQSYCSPPQSPSTNVLSPRSSQHLNNFSQQSKFVNSDFTNKGIHSSTNYVNSAPPTSKMNKNCTKNESKIHRLLEQLTALEQNSQRFSTSFRSVCSKVQHHLQQQSLKREVLSNQIAQVRIDLKEREKDIRLLIDMMATQNKVSSIVDKSTDTEQSSSGKSSYSGHGKTTVTKTRSTHKEKRNSPKSTVRIFNKV